MIPMTTTTLHAILPAAESWAASEHAQGLLTAMSDAFIHVAMTGREHPDYRDRLRASTDAKFAVAAYIAQLEARIVEGGR